jgi:hypothetical protein
MDAKKLSFLLLPIVVWVLLVGRVFFGSLDLEGLKETFPFFVGAVIVPCALLACGKPRDTWRNRCITFAVSGVIVSICGLVSVAAVVDKLKAEPVSSAAMMFSSGDNWVAFGMLFSICFVPNLLCKLLEDSVLSRSKRRIR